MGHYASSATKLGKFPHGRRTGVGAGLGGIALFVLAAMGFPGRLPQILLFIGVALLIAGCVLIVIAARSIPVIAPDYQVVELESLAFLEGCSGCLLSRGRRRNSLRLHAAAR